MSTRTRSLLALIVALLAFGVPALPASAHSELLQSTPADGEQLAEAPTQIELVFGEGVQQQGGAIVVKGPDGTRYDRSGSFVTNENVATVQVARATDAGEYTVVYRVMSADGHVVDGTFSYQVLSGTSSDAATAPAATPLSGTPTDDGAGDESAIGFVWVLGLGAIGLVLLAAVIAVAVRGRRGRQG